MWFYFLVGGIFIFLGLGIHIFKWHFLISGYNTMSKAKKANVDTEGLGRLMGLYCYFNGAIFILMGILGIMSAKLPENLAIALFGTSTLYVLIRAQRYDGNLYDENGKLREGAKKQLALALILGLVVVMGIGSLIICSSQAPNVILQEEGLEIQGIYGETVDWKAIQEVKLMESLPNIELRTNGSAFDSNLKGNFRTTEYGSVKLFVNTKNPPYIYLKADNRIIIFQLETTEETRAVFEEILSIKTLLNP